MSLDAPPPTKHAVLPTGASRDDSVRKLPVVVGVDTPSLHAVPIANTEAPDAAESRYTLHRRFDRMGRMVGDDAMRLLFGSHVMVIGLGGVGSFAAESLARSGFGELSLVDFDKICVTNSNRQLQALKTTVGQSKAVVLADRLTQINPQAKVRPIEKFYSENLSAEILGLGPDIIVDAIDNLTAKCHLLAECRKRDIPVVSSLGAAGRMDPTAIATADLARTKHDPMARAIRRILRQEHAFPRVGTFGITAVYSTERVREPVELHYDEGKGFRCVCPGGKNDQHSCDQRRVIYGTTSFVTGTFGLVCASVAVRELLSAKQPSC